MFSFRSLLQGLRGLFNRRDAERELNDELRAYLENSVQHYMAAGKSREEAELASRRDIGSLEVVKDSVRDVGWESKFEAFHQDLRYGCRLLLRSPGFTTVAIIALALGIGANTAIFSVVNSVLISPLPFESPDRLVMIWEKSPRTGKTNVVNPVNFLEWQSRNHSFQSMAALIAWHVSLSGDGEPQKVENMYVSFGFFETLGAKPLLGQTFNREDDKPGEGTAVILSEGLWRNRYAADPKIVGRWIRVDNRARRVTGVMPANFRFPFSKAELWQPLGLDRSKTAGGRYLSTVGRLKPGVTVARAQAEMTLLGRQLERERPEYDSKWGITVVGLRDQIVGDVRTPLIILMGAVALVLLIACANVANLLLMRDAGRRQEIAVRSALGASRWRLSQQFLVENGLLAGIGGAAGVLLGWCLKNVLVSLLPDAIEYSNLHSVRMDSTVLLFTCVLTALTALLFGLLPAVKASGETLQAGLKDGSRSSSAALGKARGALVVAEVALAMVLSLGAGLLIRSFVRLASVHPGFEASHVLSMQVDTAGYIADSDPKFLTFCALMLERVRSLPGVTAAGTAHFLPLGKIIPGTGFWRADRPQPPHGEEPVTEVLVIMPGYFAAMDIPLIRGSVFSDRDRKDTPLAVVINETLARSFYGNENPLGKPLSIQWGPKNPYLIAGVVGDVRQGSLKESAKPAVYLSNWQVPTGPLHLVVRTRGNPLLLARSIENEIHVLSRESPVSDVLTMDRFVSQSISEPRFNTALIAGFSTLALLLAAVGIFGVISYSVTQRTRELGIRRALGADTGEIVRFILTQAMGLAVCGIALGALVGLGLTQFLRKLLFEVTPTDWISFTGVALVLLTVSLAASSLPARRAARLDPNRALRME